jgi:hypothetical protein
MFSLTGITTVFNLSTTNKLDPLPIRQLTLLSLQPRQPSGSDNVCQYTSSMMVGAGNYIISSVEATTTVSNAMAWSGSSSNPISLVSSDAGSRNTFLSIASRAFGCRSRGIALRDANLKYNHSGGQR